jgi:XTP/dITP diphosphohydrolase
MSRVRLVLVTQNKHKLKELRPLFKKYKVEFDTTSIEKYEIRSESVEKIARVAARVAFDTLQKPVVVDDTGFFVDSLKGFPGSYAAIVLKSIGYNGILQLMADKEDRTSKFVTAVGYCDKDHLESFVGAISGNVTSEPAGPRGFGYDPIFVPDGFTRTYAQLTLEEKVSVSHRTKAFEDFLKWYTSTLDKP